MATPHARVGIDIGGTFTDLVLVDDATGAISVSKVLTTPHNEPGGACGAEGASRISRRVQKHG